MEPDMNIPAPPTASSPSGSAAALDLVTSRFSCRHPGMKGRGRPEQGAFQKTIDIRKTVTLLSGAILHLLSKRRDDAAQDRG
jgi:hypothetical protein